MHPLNRSWVVWFHNPDDSDWSFESYIELSKIDSIESFWNIYNNIEKVNIENGMFFLMKEGIKPLWEDEKNKKGGSWSFKILKRNVYDTWLDVCINCVNETILKDINKSKMITGLSISPKKSFCIIKIWNNDKKENDKELLNSNMLNMNLKECLYKAHSNR